MNAWTELNQAAVRDRIREREVEAASERLASAARSAARLAAAAHGAIVRPASVTLDRETVRDGEPIVARAIPCGDCPPASRAA